MKTQLVYLVFAALNVFSAPASAAPAVRGDSGTFTAASGLTAYVIAPVPSAAAGGVAVRRLGLDGGVLWEDRWQDGGRETPVDAAVGASGEVTVVGDGETGCVALRWSPEGRVLWSNVLQYGTSCRARTTMLDALGNAYVLATATVGGVLAPSVWKIGPRGNVLWTYSAEGGASRYGFDLAPIAGDAGVTVTTAASTDAGWVYDSFDLDAAGRPRDPIR